VNFKINWRRAALLLVGWTLVGVIFAGISYAAAIGENNKEFGFVSALRDSHTVCLSLLPPFPN
jgi:hypothetical protein